MKLLVTLIVLLFIDIDNAFRHLNRLTNINKNRNAVLYGKISKADQEQEGQQIGEFDSLKFTSNFSIQTIIIAC
jgi:hypothetical protein